MKVGVVKRRVEIPYILNKGMADSRKRSRRRQRRRRPAPSHPKKRDVVSDPKGKNPVGGTHIGLQKDVGRKNGAGGLPKIPATAYPTGPRAATAESLPGVQVGPWLRQEFVEGDAEHLGHGHDVAQTRVGRGAGHGLALLELLVGVSAHSRIVCHPLLRQPARLAQSLHAQAQLFRVRGPFSARSNL